MPIMNAYRESRQAYRESHVRIASSGRESHKVLARRMVAEGFTLPLLRDAMNHGTLQDVVASLTLAPSIGLRVGDRLAVAVAVRADLMST